MEWIPTISELDGPLYLRIVGALESDVASGRLVRGQQLPTHRKLAQTLGIDLTTVTRAYREARRRGLIDAQVGRGSFVSESTMRPATDVAAEVRIDLSMNVPPHPLEAQLDDRILQGLEAIRQKSGLTAFLNYLPPGGSDRERQIAARFLRTRVPQAAAERIVVYPGTQSILFNLLMRLAGRNDIVLTEAWTFPGLKAAAARLGIRLVGVAMDREGVLPDELKAACRAYKPKAVYLIPTLHNPTTATLSAERRAAVAATIRAAGTILVEDDAYGLLEPTASPIANLIPERTYLATTLSKCIAPALRVSYLLTPDMAAREEMCARLQAAAQMPPPLMVALATHWIESGIAERIIAAIRNEAIARQQLAARALKGVAYCAGRAGHHVWVPLSSEWRHEGFAAHLLQNGLAVVGNDAFAVDPNAPPAVRVSLGAARNRAELVEGLHVLASALRMQTAQRQVV